MNQLLLEKLPGYLKNRTWDSFLTIQDLEQKIEVVEAARDSLVIVFK